MAFLQNISRIFLRCNSSRTGHLSASWRTYSPYENSAQYSADGEKIYCGLKFDNEGSRTEEEVAMIVETARAKAFEDSLQNVAIIKIDP